MALVLSIESAIPDLDILKSSQVISFGKKLNFGYLFAKL